MTDSSDGVENRRPLRMRAHWWPNALAKLLARRGVSPNAVSIASVVFSIAAGLCLLCTRWTPPAINVVLLLAAPALVGLRGVCNLVDGLIAVECGKKTRSGELFNDLPDRISDPVTFACAGYAVVNAEWGVALGWAAACLAVITAYLRLLGGSMGARQYFVGPMAKTHRMIVLCTACVVTAIEVPLLGSTWGLLAGLAIVVVGCVVTSARRTLLIVDELESK